jgi:hypothetical protein
MSEPSGLRGWLTVLFSVAFLAALTVWLFSAGVVERIFGFATVAAGVALVVVGVISAVVERQPGCVLVGAAFFGVGVLLTAVVFGFAYLDESWTYVRGESTHATVGTCDDDGDDCESSWRLGGREYTGEVELAFDQAPGDETPVRVYDDEAVQESGLTVLVVASSGVALLSPLLVLGAVLVARRQATARHQPSGGSAVDTSSS